MAMEERPASVRDALIAEMLGDVGRLHDSVKSLDARLLPMVEACERAAQAAERAAGRAESPPVLATLTPAAASGAWRLLVVGLVLGAVLASAAAFAVVRASAVRDERTMAAGRDFLAVLPKLDAGTRQKIADALESKR